MSLKKRVISIAAVIAMTAAVIYGSTMELSGVNEEESRFSLLGQKETIYFWYADDTLTNYVNAAAVSFGEREGVRVIPVLASDSEYLEAINQASLEGTQTPDIYLLSNDSLEKAYLAGLATEIQDTKGICTGETFPQAALSAVEYQGKKLGYPLFYETSALVYNETYLEEWAKQQATKELTNAGEEGAEESSESEATENGDVDETLLAQKQQEYLLEAIPATVDDILNIADTFDVPEGVEGVMKWDVSDIFYNYWFVGQYMIAGGDAGDDAANMNINNTETIQCLEAYQNLNQFFSIESDTITYDSVVQEFIEGKLVFTVATTDVVKRLEEAKADGSFAYEYGIATMPDISDELMSRSMSVTNVAVVNGYSMQKDLANRFAVYLTDEYADTLYEQTGKVPAALNAEADNGPLQIFTTEYAGSVPLPKMMETGNFWLQLEVLFAKVWNGADITTVVQELADQMSVQTGQ
uniref:sugar ABC transporter substrate-binding protein n=1 Tax=Acetatifactor sp. TaxID=1872090 RepID=UPI00405746A5